MRAMVITAQRELMGKIQSTQKSRSGHIGYMIPSHFLRLERLQQWVERLAAVCHLHLTSVGATVHASSKYSPPQASGCLCDVCFESFCVQALCELGVFEPGDSVQMDRQTAAEIVSGKQTCGCD